MGFFEVFCGGGALSSWSYSGLACQCSVRQRREISTAGSRAWAHTVWVAIVARLSQRKQAQNAIGPLGEKVPASGTHRLVRRFGKYRTATVGDEVGKEQRCIFVACKRPVENHSPKVSFCGSATSSSKRACSSNLVFVSTQVGSAARPAAHSSCGGQCHGCGSPAQS